ncbi:MAG: hypothetical protein JSS34_06740, partial [Proteobacteria bacterium]|nr:hypothetical protein [Pseudomonadota bacterium]
AGGNADLEQDIAHLAGLHIDANADNEGAIATLRGHGAVRADINATHIARTKGAAGAVQEDIAHLTALHIDANADNEGAIATLRGHGAARADINATHVAQTIAAGGNADLEQDIARLAVLHLDADPANMIAIDKLRKNNGGTPTNFANITAPHIAAWKGTVNGDEKEIIVHLASINLAPTLPHIQATTTLRTDHAGNSIPWRHITDQHVNAHIAAGHDAPQKARIVHLAALGLPASPDNINALTALRVNHGAGDTDWNYITADHVTAYVTGANADRRAEVVHLAALNLPASAQNKTAMEALRTDNTGNQVPWARITAEHVNKYVLAENASRKEEIVHLAAQHLPANDDNISAMKAFRSIQDEGRIISAPWDDITRARIEAWVNEGNNDRKKTIAYLAVIDWNAEFTGNGSGDAVLALKNVGTSYANMTDVRLQAWIDEGDAQVKERIAHLAALNLDSNARHLGAMRALKTDHAGAQIDWNYITRDHITAYAAEADADRLEEIVHLAALNLPADANNRAAMEALRTDNAGNPIGWDHITADHVNAYIAEADVNRRAEIVHLAALHLAADANTIPAMTALRTDNAHNAIDWDHITAAHVNAYFVAIDVNRKAEIVHLAALNLPANPDNIRAMEALRTKGTKAEKRFPNIDATRIADWIVANPAR